MPRVEYTTQFSLSMISLTTPNSPYLTLILVTSTNKNLFLFPINLPFIAKALQIGSTELVPINLRSVETVPLVQDESCKRLSTGIKE